MELSRSSTRLIFLATLNMGSVMYHIVLMDWINVFLPMLNCFVILFALVEIEHGFDEIRNKLEVRVVEHIQ